VFACFLVVVALVIVPSTIFCSPPPLLTGYDYELDLTSLMANTTPAVQDIPTPTYYHAYHKVVGDTLHLGIVCNGSAPSGTNDFSWCGFGFRVSDNSSTGMVVGDGLIGYVDPNDGTVFSVDMSMNGRTFGIISTCKTGSSLVCPDSARTLVPCQESILTTTGYRQNEYLVLEYTRKLDTGDACDKVIVVEEAVAILFSIGLVNTASTWPWGIQKHDVAANVLSASYFVTFHTSVTHTTQQQTTQQTTQQQTTQQTTQQQTTQQTTQQQTQRTTQQPQQTHAKTHHSEEASGTTGDASGLFVSQALVIASLFFVLFGRS